MISRSGNMALYKNRYRIESFRLSGWDYSSPGYYFITICTKNRIHWFGKIINGKMVLSEYGKIVKNEWLKSFKIRTELYCDIYVIMPDHIHAIIVINGNQQRKNDGRDARPCVSRDDTDYENMHRLYRAPRSISSFIAGFKSSATKTVNIYRNTPGTPIWQPRYYDRVIRDRDALNNIRRYIHYNPANWKYDGKYTIAEYP